MTVFADTFALIAWLNPRDNAHALVTAYLDRFTSLTPLVAGRVHVRRNMGRRAA